MGNSRITPKKALEVYKENASFQSYVEKYCRSRGISVEEAVTHSIVLASCKWYLEGSESKINPILPKITM